MTRPVIRIIGFGLAFGLAGAQLSALAAEPAAGSESQWVHYDSKGRLAYKSLPQGDVIMDFSFAGYMGGGVSFPSVPVKMTVKPSGGDDTRAIQAAIESVSEMSAVKGLRGAVLLAPGAYSCNGTLSIRSGGVVLRGSGSGPGGTTITMTGTPHVCMALFGSNSIEEAGPEVAITDAYVPSGATSFNTAGGLGLRVGDTIRIRRPVTSAWVKMMSMDTLVRSGRKETWLSESGEIRTERVIRAITGSRITLDIPLSDSFDSKYLKPPGGSVIKSVVEGRVAQVGVENLRIVSPPQPVEISQRHHQAIRLNGAEDAWLRDILIEDTVNSVGIGSSARRVTVRNVEVRHSVGTKGAAKPADFSTSGSQVLFDRCSATGDSLFYFVTGARVTGPNVLLNCTFHGNGHLQPHARWATGLLVDGCRVEESGIDFMNRGEMGSGHGWTIGWAVAWNCVARSYVIQQPPGAANWAIGCQGTRQFSGMPFGHKPELPEGIFDSHGQPVNPASLYLAQLRQRLGPQAVKNIGY